MKLELKKISFYTQNYSILAFLVSAHRARLTGSTSETLHVGNSVLTNFILNLKYSILTNGNPYPMEPLYNVP
jgi:hypothetical protein